jgi:hypothetical protein
VNGNFSGDAAGTIRARLKGVMRLASSILLAAATCSAAQAQTVVGGFYRQVDKAPVMYQYSASNYCHVQNEGQMAAFGGFAKVKVVSVLAMRGQQTGDCSWPDGFYRRSNEPAVYRLFDGSICLVVNEQQMAAFGGFKLVKIVKPTSDLARGRGNFARCNARAG